MSFDMDYSTIYIDLDSLMDTRITILHAMDPKLTSEMIEKDYFHRLSDVFEGYDMDKFKEVYNRRDKRTLFRSYRTKAHTLLNFFINQTYLAISNGQYVKYPRVTINIHPYELTDKESALIIKAVNALVEHECDINVVSLTNDELTPRHILDNYQSMVMYDYSSWLDKQSELKTFNNICCPMIPMIAPLLFGNPSELFVNDFRTMVEAVEEYIAPFIKIKFYPVSVFSVDLESYAMTLK